MPVRSPDAPPDKRDDEPALVRWSNTTKAVVGALTAVITFVPLFVAFVLHPFGGGSKACTGARSATLSHVVVDRSVSRRGYFELQNAPIGGGSKASLDARGKLVYVVVASKGLKGVPLQLRWWLLQSDGEPLADLTVQNQLASVLTPRACEDTPVREPVWVPIPQRAGQFKAEIRLVDPNGLQLDAVRTAAFAGAVPHG